MRCLEDHGEDTSCKLTGRKYNQSRVSEQLFLSIEKIHILTIDQPPSQAETDAPPAHSTLLSPHPPGAHLREGRKVTSTGYSPLLIQIRSPIPERSSIDSVSQTSLPHDGSQQTRVGKCLAAHQAAPTQKATSRRAKTRGLALSKIIPNFAEQKGQLRPPKP